MRTGKLVFLTIIILYCAVLSLEAQQSRRSPKQKSVAIAIEPPLPEVHVEVSADFPGGRDSLTRYLHRNIRYPAAAREDNIQGSVTSRFLLNGTGKATRIMLLRDIGGGCGKEVLRVLEQMPAWQPFRYNGKAVPTVVTLSIRFEIAE